MQAGVLAEGDEAAYGATMGIVLLDITPLALGIISNNDLDEEYFSKIIEANTKVPTKNTETYITLHDNQIKMSITVLQGMSYKVDDNRMIGSYLLEGLTPRPRGETKVDVTFDINSDGIITVTAKEQGKNNTLDITIEGRNALTPNELEGMIANAKEDLERLK